MPIQPLYTDVLELTVDFDGQTVFPLTTLPSSADESLVVFNHLSFFHTEDYDITSGPDILTWTGVSLDEGEKLYLISDIGTAALYEAIESLYVAEDGQTEFGLTGAPGDQSPFMILYAGLIFLSEAGDFTVSDRLLSWSGVDLKKGELLRVVYRED